MALDIAWSDDGSHKCIDYRDSKIAGLPFLDLFSAKMSDWDFFKTHVKITQTQFLQKSAKTRARCHSLGSLTIVYTTVNI